MDRRRLPGFERAKPGRSQVAGDAAHRKRIAPVRGDADVDDRIVQPCPGGVALADRRILRQFDDAIVLVAERQFAETDEHAFGFHAAYVAHLQNHAAGGNDGARRGEDGVQPGARIRRTADDGALGAVADIDAAGAQPVGVRVLHRLDDACRHEGGQRLCLVLDRFHFETDGGQRRGDVIERHGRVEVVMQPGQREFHPPMPSCRIAGANGEKP